MIYIIGTEDILNCVAYEDMIQDKYPKLDIFIADDKAITAMEKQRRIAPIKPTNSVIKRQPCKNTQFRRR